MFNLETIICAIHNGNYENEVFLHLCTWMAQQKEKLESKTKHLEHQLNIIKKINQNKNEAIDALCELD